MLEDFNCPKCNSLFHDIKDEWRGRKIKCSDCGHRFVVEAKQDPVQRKKAIAESIGIVVALAVNGVSLYLAYSGKVKFDDSPFVTHRAINGIFWFSFAIFVLLFHSKLKSK